MSELIWHDVSVSDRRIKHGFVMVCGCDWTSILNGGLDLEKGLDIYWGVSAEGIRMTKLRM